MSPPKTCVVLQPPDENSSDKAGHLRDTRLNWPLLKENEGVGGIPQIKTGIGCLLFASLIFTSSLGEHTDIILDMF
jgi:hypothetical protein